MLIVWLWTAFSLVGLGLSIWNIRDAKRDLRAVEAAPEPDPDTIEAARYFRDAERVRGLQFLMVATVGIAALLIPFLSIWWATLVGKAIGWTLLAHVLLLMANTALSTRYRRRSIRKENP